MNGLLSLVLGIIAHNATGSDYIGIDYDTQNGLSITSQEYTVPPAPPGTVSVRVIYKSEIRGWTWIENTSPAAWSSSHAWAPWSLGYLSGGRHVGGGYYGGAAANYLWQTNTSSMGNPTSYYWPLDVGWPGSFDGVLDGLGTSGRWWQLRGIRVWEANIASSDGVQAWKMASPIDGKHHFWLDAKATGGFVGTTPPGATAKALGSLRVYPIVVQYTTQ